MGGWMHANPWTAESKRVKSGCKSGTYCCSYVAWSFPAVAVVNYPTSQHMTISQVIRCNFDYSLSCISVRDMTKRYYVMS